MFETVLSKAAALKITYGWVFLGINHVHWHVEVVTGERGGGIQTVSSTLTILAIVTLTYDSIWTIFITFRVISCPSGRRMLHAVATQRPQQALGIGSSVYPYKTKHTCDCTHTDIADSPLEALSIEMKILSFTCPHVIFNDCFSHLIFLLKGLLRGFMYIKSWHI